MLRRTHALDTSTDKKSLKYVSLLTLVIQNSALILSMRYTRASVPADKLYLASTAVLMSEVIKTLVCLVVVYRLLPSHGRSFTKLYNFLFRELVINWKETIKLALPAILYLIQVISNAVVYTKAHHQNSEQSSICSCHKFGCCNFSSNIPTQNLDNGIFQRCYAR